MKRRTDGGLPATERGTRGYGLVHENFSYGLRKKKAARSAEVFQS